MDSRGGCCIARYAAGAYDMSQVDRIMLRFRPIAPKPVAGTTTTNSDGSSSESSGTFSKGGGRTKRKYVRDNNNNNNNRRSRRRKKTSSLENNCPVAPPVVTLPLLPETPDPKEARNNTNSKGNNNNNNNNSNNMNWKVPVWLSFENRGGAAEPYWYGGASEHAASRVVGASSYSCVTVECVTDTWGEGEGEGLLGRNDEERKVNLGDDTCPGFISDVYGRVTWANVAYREMVGHEGDSMVLVLLVVKVGAVVPYYPCCSFTCRVRVVQYHECGKERSSLTVPCDVWRMDSGGFAWRLDLKAALTLRLLAC